MYDMKIFQLIEIFKTTYVSVISYIMVKSFHLKYIRKDFTSNFNDGYYVMTKNLLP